jgi:hypothetical protein
MVTARTIYSAISRHLQHVTSQASFAPPSNTEARAAPRKLQ